MSGLFLADAIQFGLYVLQDIARAELRREGAHIAEREEVARLRDQMLRRLDTTELFPAGKALVEGPDGRPDPRRVEVAVTERDFVLLDAEVRRPEERIARLPREGEKWSPRSHVAR